MATTKKAMAMAEEFMSDLKQRQTALDVSLSFDTDESPLIRIGTGVAGAKGALVKISPVSWTAKDILGLASPVYTPHVLKLVFEAVTVSTTAADTDPNTWVEKALILAMAFRRGTIVELYESAAGSAPAVSAMVSGQLKTRFDPSAAYPLISGQ